MEKVWWVDFCLGEIPSNSTHNTEYNITNVEPLDKAQSPSKMRLDGYDRGVDLCEIHANAKEQLQRDMVEKNVAGW